MHRLVQLATRQLMKMQKQVQSFFTTALRIIERKFPHGTFGTWEQCRTLLPHAISVYNSRNDVKVSRISLCRLLQNVSRFFFEQGQCNESEELLVKETYELHKNTLGPKHPDTLV